MTSLSDIPEEVIYHNLLPCLSSIHDLFRLRRVSKSFYNVVNHFLLQREISATTELEINGTTSTFDTFLQNGIPTTHIYINNSNTATSQIFEDPALLEFLERYGNKITHLKVYKCPTFQSDLEYKFYEALVNIQSLELENIDGIEKWNDPEGHQHPSFPPNLENLKEIRFGRARKPTSVDNWSDFCYVMAFLRHCSKVESLNYPLFYNDACHSGEHPMAYHHSIFICLSQQIKTRRMSFQNEPNLKYLDLQNFRLEIPDVTYCGSALKRLCNVCRENGVQLLNVDVNILTYLFNCNGRTFQELLFPLTSVQNFHTIMLNMELPNLEKIVISGTSICGSVGSEVIWNEKAWPNLRMLDITVDSICLASERDEELVETAELLYWLFSSGKVRPGLIELALRFSKDSLRTKLPFPCTEDVISVYPNLKKLTLCNWPGTNEDLVVLWRGLETLEDLCIEDCVQVGDKAFLGCKQDTEPEPEPAFLKLGKLKKLTLRGLDIMTGITDTSFELVFRNLKLDQFYLFSKAPLKTITETGIKSLLTGEFAKYITKFPFEEWSLENTSKKDFYAIKAQFRSSQMI